MYNEVIKYHNFKLRFAMEEHITDMQLQDYWNVKNFVFTVSGFEKWFYFDDFMKIDALLVALDLQRVKIL